MRRQRQRDLRRRKRPQLVQPHLVPAAPDGETGRLLRRAGLLQRAPERPPPPRPVLPELHGHDRRGLRPVLPGLHPDHEGCGRRVRAGVLLRRVHAG